MSAASILIVDDEVDVRSSLKRVLRLDKYEVSEEGSLGDLLARDDLKSFQCIILDRKLPDGTSDEVLPELKERAPDADVLIVTGYTDLQGTLAALRHGAEDYLIKPVNPDDLRASLRRLFQMRAMKTALQESEARHRGILETAPIGILTLDEKRDVESANPAIEAIFGFADNELIGHSMDALLATSHRSGFLESFQAVMSEGRSGSASREMMARRKGGQAFPIAATLSCVGLPNKRVGAVIIEDITERKQLEKDVLKASEEEGHRIAQDLHDGLASHLAGVGLLCKMVGDSVEAPHAATVNQISTLIDEGIQQTRAVARGLYPVEDEPEGLMNSLGLFAAQWRHDLKIDCRFECAEPVLVQDNVMATHLYRIAQEAVNNAVRHAKAEVITIELTERDSEFKLCIRDNGVGLADTPSKRSNGIGLRTMSYRAGLLQGTLEIGRGGEGGTEVKCLIPRSKD